MSKAGRYLFSDWCLFLKPLLIAGDDQRGYNIPEIRACPEVGEFLSRSEEELACANHNQTPELVRRLMCDSYMFLYQTPTKSSSTSNPQGMERKCMTFP